MEDHVKIDISTLGYDLNAIMEFVFQNNHKDKTSELKETYHKNADGALEIVEKELSEIKQEGSSDATLRYDLVKDLMTTLNGVMMFDDEGDDEVEMPEVSVPAFGTLGETLALNTLLKEGMLTNVNLKEILGVNEQ